MPDLRPGRVVTDRCQATPAPDLLTPEAVRRRGGDAPHLVAALRWCETYLTAPHPDLGRGGAVCPYARGALHGETLWFADQRGAELTCDDVDAIAHACRLLFSALPPRSRPHSINKAIVVVLPDLPPHRQRELVGGLLARVKPQYVEDGLMVGPVFPGNVIPGAHNAEFRPMDGPVPMFAVRELLPTDLPFLQRPTDSERAVGRYVRAYLRHLGEQLSVERRAAAEAVLASVQDGTADPADRD